MSNPALASQHIILIGFKNTGKSTIARALAHKLTRDFFDLDHALMAVYSQQFGKSLSCDQIIDQHGEAFFRDLEQQAFADLLQHKPAVIATGGGAILHETTRQLMTGHYIIHITAQPEIVFGRIMAKGRPAIFPAQESPQLAFKRIWEERSGIYERLANFSLDNSDRHWPLRVEEIVAHLQEISS